MQQSPAKKQTRQLVAELQFHQGLFLYRGPELAIVSSLVTVIHLQLMTGEVFSNQTYVSLIQGLPTARRIALQPLCLSDCRRTLRPTSEIILGREAESEGQMIVNSETLL